MSKLNLTHVAVNFLLAQLKENSLSFKIPEKTEISERDHRIVNSLMKWDSGYRENAIEFASALTGVEYKKMIAEKKTNYMVGMIVVPLRNPNKHSYPLNVPTCIIYDQQAWDSTTNEPGNALPGKLDEENVRLAAPEEIETFYSELSKKEPQHIQNFISSILRHMEIVVK